MKGTAKNIMPKSTKNNLRRLSKAKDLQQNSKSSHSKNIILLPVLHSLLSQHKNAKRIRLSNTSDQKHTDITVMQKKNGILEIKRKPDELFDLIYTGKVTLTLPNRSWSIHYAEKPIRCIVVSEINIHHDSGLGFVPLYTKQIIFYEKMNYDIFLFNTKAPEKNVPATMESVADVMNIITYTNNLKLCSGGPEVSLYNNVNLECAYRDSKEKWRHNLCSLEISQGDTCESCLSLEDILKRRIQRNKHSPRTKGFNGSRKKKRSQ